MSCHHYRSPDGTVNAIVCTKSRSRCCSVCGKRAGILCDFPDAARRSLTCDKPLCRGCARLGPRGQDYCPSHGIGAANAPVASDTTRQIQQAEPRQSTRGAQLRLKL